MPNSRKAVAAPAAQSRTKPPKIMHHEAFSSRLSYLSIYLLGADMFPDAANYPIPDPHPRNLLHQAEHGSITAVTLDHIAGNPMVGISLLGEKPRFLHPLDYVAVSLAMAFGLPLTLQKTGSGFAYPRFRANIPGTEEGQNIYLLRVLADAGPWQTVRHLDPLGDLAASHEGQRLDHHYLGRDALRLGSIQSVWDEGKKARVPKLGRSALLAAALHYFDQNAPAGMPITRQLYADTLFFAFALADWRHGRADKRAVDLKAITPPVLSAAA